MDEPATSEPRRNTRGPGAVILGIVGVVMIAVVVIMVLQRQPSVKGASEAPEGIEITVTAPIPGTPFTVDGAPAGKTPQALKLRGRTQPLRIEGNGMQIVVTPDRSQVINLDPKLRR
ncbi:MAG TPA: hypothetical protein VM513_16015 [Kofleriaceae bacterium]|jgi:hypothetical protein|nr:hypothetical protein [Kofleriaceae bacterium]